MAANVKFLKGTADGYAALATKDSNTFYYTGSDLYLGEIKLSNASDLTDALTRLTEAEGDIDDLEAAVGTLSGLSTTDKDNLVNAINELYDSITAAKAAGIVTVEEDDSSSDYAKVYTVKQGGTAVGTINIPKDMVVSSGTIEVNPSGQTAGTYIVLTLANADSTKIYINVGDLVDIYTAESNAAQVQLTISSGNEISAEIVDGSVDSAALASSAVTTAKIADGNVTLAKLATAVQNSLSNADSALQASDITTGSANGTIAVDGTDVAVKGLGSAAYTASTAYDTAGAAAAVVGASTDASTANTVYGAKAYADSLNTAMDTRVDALEEALGDGGSVDTQIEEAISALDVTDTAVADQYVSAVSQTDGKISVTRTTIPIRTVTTGTSNGTIAVNGTDVSVYGLGTAAYTDSTAYDAAGAAEDALTKAKEYVDTCLTWGSF